MSDLGRGVQLPPLTINQPDGGVRGRWLWCAGMRRHWLLPGAGQHFITPTYLYVYGKTAGSAFPPSFFSLFHLHLLLWYFFFLLCFFSFLAHLSSVFFPPFYLETANIHHPRPNSLSTESSSEVWAGQFYSVDKIWEYQEQLVSPSISLLRWIQKKALIPDWFSR